MSRFGDYDGEEYFPNQAFLWHANVKRALAGKRGKKALAELRDALLALPEKRLISGALCTVNPDKRLEDTTSPWYREDLGDKLESEGQGVCAVGAFLWYKRVKAGDDPQEAFDSLPTLLDMDGDADYQTAKLGENAGLTYTLASTLAYRNDQSYEAMSPEQRYEAFMNWLDEQLGEPAVVGGK